MTAMATAVRLFKKYWPADLHLIGKGYHPFPYHLLADLPDGSGSAASKAGIWSSVASYRVMAR